MGELIQKLILTIGSKATNIDPSSFVTQDNINTILEFMKEMVKPL